MNVFLSSIHRLNLLAASGKFFKQKHSGIWSLFSGRNGTSLPSVWLYWLFTACERKSSAKEALSLRSISWWGQEAGDSHPDRITHTLLIPGSLHKVVTGVQISLIFLFILAHSWGEMHCDCSPITEKKTDSRIIDSWKTFDRTPLCR